ncbi:HAD-IA family hydrolase [Aquimarina sp. I32.4]|uniref:HAD-IA family hydrolase n=1 Tax=Aquimarina sp. I32.4 TaxID=2053903 RepID=UPI000CDE693E|nr:HAD-IA family hydrolase [Aquimarina sp. I32.4]
MKTHIKALLLDFGSVISKSLFERQKSIENNLNLPKGILKWKGPFDPKSDPLWMSMQKDEITERKYWGTRAKEIGELIEKKDWSMLDLLKSMGDKTNYNEILRPQALQVISIVKKAGLKVGVLSNEIELFTGKDFVDNLPFRHDLDTFYDATHSDILKPDPRAYNTALNNLQLQPNEVLFVDDQLRNIAGAMKCGLRTLHFDITQPDACYQYILNVLNIDTPVLINN